MEGTESPSSSLFNLDSWLRSSDRRVVWAGVSISTTLVDRVHRAFAGLASSMNVCGSPLTQWLWGEDSAAEELWTRSNARLENGEDDDGDDGGDCGGE